MAGGTSAVFFDRETGQLVENKLRISAKGLGDAQLEQLLFAPDGKGLICVCSEANSGRYLRRLELRLNPDELKLVEKGFDLKGIIGAQSETDQGNYAVQRDPNLKHDAIDAWTTLKGSKPISHAEIGRRYMNSVVLVKSNIGSGTAFVIGSGGYLLTCAHVIPEEGKITVTYVKDKKSIDTEAALLQIDQEKDLALLKIEAGSALTSVILEEDDKDIAAGDSVTVIGNPGLGNEILTHTVTTGVISNVNREFEGQKYFQTSAAVNSGNSGGPVFGPNGHVIGLVVLKARIDATAFAVPVSALRTFINQAIESSK